MYRLLFIFIVIFGMLISRAIGQEPDTMYAVKLKEVTIKDIGKWDNDTARYRFNQTRFYVQSILPYLDAATFTFNEIDKKMNETGITKRERKLFVHAREEELRNNFEGRIKTLNETQGVLLIKLIARQTGVNIYSILNEFKNPFTAIKWQTWARMNGFNLNRKYDPKDEPLLEQVMTSLGYDLPSFCQPL